MIQTAMEYKMTLAFLIETISKHSDSLDRRLSSPLLEEA